MTNLALNHLAVDCLNGTTFFGRKLVAEPNGLSFYDCRGHDGRRCSSCPSCARFDNELSVQKDLITEPLADEIKRLTEALNQVQHDARVSQIESDQKLAHFAQVADFYREENATLSRKLIDANLVVTSVEGSLVDIRV